MRQRAIFEHMRAARNQVSCDAAKRDWQIIKALQDRIRQRNSIQDEFDLLPRIETSRKPGAVAQPKFKRIRVLSAVLLAPEGKIRELSGTAQDRIPVNTFHQLADLWWVHTRGVRPTN